MSVFVDGENFVMRLQKLANAVAPRYKLPVGYAVEDVAYWTERYSRSTFGLNEEKTELVRISFYTSARGDETQRRQIRRELQHLGVGHTFIARRTKQGKSKTVDIQLATDLLVTASDRQVDDIVLVSADADFLPVVTTAKQLGVRVFLAFPGLQALDNDRVENQDEVKKALGLALDGDYPLAFDGILGTFEWLDYQKLSPRELPDIARKVLWPAISGGQAACEPIVYSETSVGYKLIEGKLSLDSNGAVRWVIGRDQHNKGEISIWPTATFAERYRKSTGY